jgi:hypothetical protein
MRSYIRNYEGSNPYGCHTYYQGEWPEYVWHQECTCDRCRQKYEAFVREQQSDGEGK